MHSRQQSMQHTHTHDTNNECSQQETGKGSLHATTRMQSPGEHVTKACSSERTKHLDKNSPKKLENKQAQSTSGVAFQPAQSSSQYTPSILSSTHDLAEKACQKILQKSGVHTPSDRIEAKTRTDMWDKAKFGTTHAHPPRDTRGISVSQGCNMLFKITLGVSPAQRKPRAGFIINC
eukprot:1159440-Pelagomonas_calceolata.AAC.8